MQCFPKTQTYTHNSQTAGCGIFFKRTTLYKQSAQTLKTKSEQCLP